MLKNWIKNWNRCQPSDYRYNDLQQIWTVEAFNQSLQGMLDNLTPELIDQLQIVNQDVTSSLDEAVQILRDTHATENRDHNDSDNESSVSESGYNGDISESDSDMSDASESDSDMSDVSESDSDTSDSSDISHSE